MALGREECTSSKVLLFCKDGIDYLTYLDCMVAGGLDYTLVVLELH